MIERLVHGPSERLGQGEQDGVLGGVLAVLVRIQMAKYVGGGGVDVGRDLLAERSAEAIQVVLAPLIEPAEVDVVVVERGAERHAAGDRKSTRLNSSH